MSEHDDDSIEVSQDAIEDAQVIGLRPGDEPQEAEGETRMFMSPIEDLPDEVRQALLGALGVEMQEATLEASGPLTDEQQQRVEAIHAARFALEKRSTGSVFSNKGDSVSSTPPSAADLLRIAKFILTGSTV